MTPPSGFRESVVELALGLLSTSRAVSRAPHGYHAGRKPEIRSVASFRAVRSIIGYGRISRELPPGWRDRHDRTGVRPLCPDRRPAFQEAADGDLLGRADYVVCLASPTRRPRT